jgi:dethiobiotin synthetase
MTTPTPCLIRCRRTLRGVWRASALTWAGWIANQIDPDMAQVDTNVAPLQRLIRAPKWGGAPLYFQL